MNRETAAMVISSVAIAANTAIAISITAIMAYHDTKTRKEAENGR